MKKKKTYKMKLNTKVSNYNNNNNNHNNHIHNNNSKKKVQFDIAKNNIYYAKTETNINRIRKTKSYTQLNKYINFESKFD